jgi:hypothetical protein
MYSMLGDVFARREGLNLTGELTGRHFKVIKYLTYLKCNAMSGSIGVFANHCAATARENCELEILYLRFMLCACNLSLCPATTTVDN